ncbi:MAG TPA: lactate permease LctP family transporter [Acidobacteriota bacterium]|jgi:lactate permease
MEWIQIYNPAGNAVISTLLAALPIVVLLVLLAAFEVPAQWAAMSGLAAALLIAIVFYRMPAATALASAGYGAAFGLVPIGWIIITAVFLYNLTVETGQFEIIKHSVASLSADRRVQALLIGYSFGAFIEGAAGFGTPVAICAALLMGLGFPPLYAAGLCLIANTAPVAFGALGTPILTLAAVTQQDPFILGQMAGRQLPFVSLLVTIWLVVTMSGWKGFKGVWPVVLVSGGSFAVVQFFWSNYVGPELVDILGGLVSLFITAGFAAWWKPKDNWEFPENLNKMPDANAAAPNVPVPARAMPASRSSETATYSRGQVVKAWMPWVFLSVFVFCWGLPPVKAFLNGGPASLRAYRATGKPSPPNPALSPQIQVPLLHKMVYRDFPVVPVQIDRGQIGSGPYRQKNAEAAVYSFNWLSASGTGILVAALATALYLRIRLRILARVAGRTLVRMKWPLLTIACMLALGYVTRYSGTDATLGLAFTHTGVAYPFFAALLGWLGVALTGSDTSSNVLFGSLQKITAQQLSLDPVLITVANSTGGVMGKMVDAQSIVVSTAATNQSGHEGAILRFVFWHSVALACIMGLIVLLQAYVFPWMIPK